MPLSFTDDMLGFGFVRIFTGDELSRRAKFALITWIGQNVSPLKRAKMSTNKAIVKEVIHVSDVCNVHTLECRSLSCRVITNGCS